MYLYADKTTASDVVKLVSAGMVDAGVLNSDIVSANQDEYRDKYELRVVDHIDYQQNIELLAHIDLEETMGIDFGYCINMMKEHIEKIVIAYRTDIKVSRLVTLY